MENFRIRLRFSSVMKNISKNNLKFNLEIVPSVTSIANIDKLKWSHEKDKIEYIFPVNHKIIIKKLKPNPESIKVYHSCVDLLPSLLSNVHIYTGDIYRVISDNNIILNKEKSDMMPITDTASVDIKMDNTMHHDLITPSHVPEKLKTQSYQTESHEDTESRPSRIMIKRINIDQSTSTSMLQNNYNRKLCVKLKYDNIQPNKANDYFDFDPLSKNRESSLIANILQEVNYLKYNKDIKIKTNKLSRILSPQQIVNGEFDEETIISNIRIQPEIRVARFVEKMKKEFMSLKTMLDDIFVKCSLLGFCKSSLVDIDLILGTNPKEKRLLKREESNNRVVYSIVFDE